MEISQLRDIINQYKTEVCYFETMQDASLTNQEKEYYHKLSEKRTEELAMQIYKSFQIAKETVSEAANQKEITLEELASNDGSGGKPAYVSVNGKVYDVSLAPSWGGGTHFGQYAGKDLSQVFMGCHMGIVQVLEKYPVVGMLKK